MARRAERSTTVMFLQPVIYFGRAFPNWRARVIPAIVISGFLAFVSKNPICFSDGSVSNHHVLDKYGWAWRDPKYKSETELCAMLKWAKEKGLTIEELSI